MTEPFTPPRLEMERVARLRDLAVMDTPPEPIFDALARAAADVSAAPFALITLLASDRPWIKASVGLPAGLPHVPHRDSFCVHALRSGETLEVPDALLDPRFAANPLVSGPLGIRFYIGALIVLSDGTAVGCLCVMDRVPRRFSAAQRATLAAIAAGVAQAFEFRARALHAIEGLTAAQDRLHDIYNRTPAMLHSIDATGRLVKVSDLWLEGLGYRRDEVLGRPSIDFLTEDSRRRAAEVVLPAFFREGRCDQVEYQMLRKDGSVMEVLLSAVLERDAEGRPRQTMAVLEDVSGRREAERERLVSEARYRALVEDQSEWVCLASPDGELLFVNDAYARALGKAPHELIGTSLFDAVAEADRELVARQLHEVCNSGEAGQLENRVRGPDGEMRWMAWTNRALKDVRSKEVKVHSVGRDVTANKCAEQALRASQDFLERTGRIAGVGGWKFEIATRTLTWTDHTCRLHDLPPGYRPTVEEALSFYAPEGRELIKRAAEEAIALGSEYDIELPFVSAKGRRFWARTVGAVEFENGRPARLIGAIQDVTQRKEMERKLAENLQLLQVTLESIGDAVITTDVDGRVQWLNPVAERLTGWPKLEAQGQPLHSVFDILDQETRQFIADPVATCLAEGRAVGLASDTVLISRDGAEYGIEDSAAPIRSPSGEVLGAVLVFHDVSEQRRLSHEMSHRARHDALTGLANRAEFEARVGRVLTRVHEDDSANALMYIDLDQFKLVNDACGHSVGDQLLRQVAGLLQACVRGRDTVARLGGDEFGVILEHCDTAQAARVAQKICDQMDEFRFLHDGRRFRVGTSIGLVPLDARWPSMAAVLQAADTSCYAAKDAGRNRVHVWFDTDRAMKTRQGEMQWVARLEQALDEDRFELYGQRIVPIGASAGGLHCEVLLRLREADGSVVPPGAFLPAAERFHMATRIDRWVVRHVFEWLGRLGGGADLIDTVSINLSGQSIGDRAFHQQLVEMVAHAPFDVRKLCFEITETSAVTHLADARVFIDEVRRLGVRIALDDFGAGASSFGYLKSLPVDFLKIDGQFITDVLEDELDNAAVRCFCEVAKVVGVRTIAEFVEREDVLLALGEIGVDLAQGYLIQRPEPLAELAEKVVWESRQMPLLAQ